MLEPEPTAYGHRKRWESGNFALRNRFKKAANPERQGRMWTSPIKGKTFAESTAPLRRRA